LAKWAGFYRQICDAVHCGKISKVVWSPWITYDKKHTRFGTLYIHLYVFRLGFGGYLFFVILLFLLLTSFSFLIFFTGVVGGFFGVI